MSRDELRAAYPGAADAVEFHEQAIPESSWNFMRAWEMAPAWVIQLMLEETGPAPTTGRNWHTPGISLRPQMEHPDFARYVAAKLGAV